MEIREQLQRSPENACTLERKNADPEPQVFVNELRSRVRRLSDTEGVLR